MHRGIILTFGILLAHCGSTNTENPATPGEGGRGNAGAGGGTAGFSGVSGYGGSAGTNGGAAGFSTTDASAVDRVAAPDGDCGSISLDATPVPGNVLVVFDQSDSMDNAFDRKNSNSTKWEIGRDALASAVSPLSAQLNLGAIFFPTGKKGKDTCSLVAPITESPQLPLEPGASFLTKWKNHFGSGFETVSGTPMQAAIERAETALPDPAPMAGARAVVLITDGAPNCEEEKTNPQGILSAVSRLSARGIKSYVIGLPGSEVAKDLLTSVAQAGGTSQYIVPTDAAELQKSLASIVSGTIDQCSFTFNPPPPDLTQVHLMVLAEAQKKTPYEIPRDTGYTLSADGTRATILPEVCGKLKAGTITKVRFIFGCPDDPNIR